MGPSLRSENSGNDPCVNLVPTGQGWVKKENITAPVKKGERTTTPATLLFKKNSNASEDNRYSRHFTSPKCRCGQCSKNKDSSSPFWRYLQYSRFRKIDLDKQSSAKTGRIRFSEFPQGISKTWCRHCQSRGYQGWRTIQRKRAWCKSSGNGPPPPVYGY